MNRIQLRFPFWNSPSPIGGRIYWCENVPSSSKTLLQNKNQKSAVSFRIGTVHTGGKNASASGPGFPAG
jgi:hypothetical protein